MNSKVTVIVPVYNSGGTIDKCLFSLLRQSIIPQIIVVNDGSTDDTAQKLAFFQGKSNIKIIYQSNQGVSAARNKGLSLVNTEFFTFVDSDDVVKNGYIENLLKGMKNTSIDLSICNYDVFDISKNGKIKFINSGKFKNKILNTEDTLISLFKINGIEGFTVNKLFRTKIIRKYGIRFDTNLNLFEDLKFCFNYICHIKKAYLNNKVEYIYQRQEDGISSKIKLDNKKTDFSFFNTCYDFLQNPISQNKKIKRILRSQLATTATACLRSLYLNHIGGEKKHYLKTIIRTNYKYLFFNSSVNLKEKIKATLIIAFPSIIKKMDQIKYNK